jgi:hypothetical protein
MIQLLALFTLGQSAPVEVPKPIELDLTGASVTATAATPELKVVAERPPARFVSAIQLREDFNAEIARSAELVR